MEVERTIKFDRQETAVLEAARRSLPIAHRDDKFGVDDEFDDAARSLGALITPGSTITDRLLARAETTLVDLLQAIQMDRVHFTMLRDNPPPTERLPEGAVPLIADPREMAVKLVEAREAQQAEVTEALTLVRRARKVIA